MNHLRYHRIAEVVNCQRTFQFLIFQTQGIKNQSFQLGVFGAYFPLDCFKQKCKIRFVCCRAVVFWRDTLVNKSWNGIGKVHYCLSSSGQSQPLKGLSYCVMAGINWAITQDEGLSTFQCQLMRLLRQASLKNHVANSSFIQDLRLSQSKQNCRYSL